VLRGRLVVGRRMVPVVSGRMVPLRRLSTPSVRRTRQQCTNCSEQNAAADLHYPHSVNPPQTKMAIVK
jgi:hypothetical protein